VSSSRRAFLKSASLLAASAAATGTACQVQGPKETDASQGAERVKGLDRELLDAAAEAMLPESLGRSGIRAATDAFVGWVDGYAPVAEEMHGYGYSDVRYLPADPAPAWRAQLSALDLLAQRVHRTAFAALAVPARRALIETVLREQTGDRLPAPLRAPHVTLALLSHWCASPDAWNRALGRDVSPLTCRPLDGSIQLPRARSAPVVDSERPS
jgi:hypothetical protein